MSEKDWEMIQDLYSNLSDEEIEEELMDLE